MPGFSGIGAACIGGSGALPSILSGLPRIFLAAAIFDKSALLPAVFDKTSGELAVFDKQLSLSLDIRI